MARILELPYEFHLPDEGDPFWDRLKAKARQIDDTNMGEHRTMYTDEQAFATVFEDDLSALEECLAGTGWGYCTAAAAMREIWGAAEDVTWEPCDDGPPPPEPPAYMAGVKDGLTPGARFRVVKEGARLRGMVSAGPGASGFADRPLAVGDTIVCRGYGPGWGSDPGYGYHWVDDELAHATFHPSPPSDPSGRWTGSVFSYGQPQVGYLEPVAEEHR